MMNDLSKRIRELRTAARMTQSELADRLHVTRQAVSNWENQKTRPDLPSLEAIAVIFSMDLTDLLYGKVKRTHNRRQIAFAAVFSALVAVGFLLQCFAVPAAERLFTISYFSGAYWVYSALIRVLYGFLVPAILSAVSIYQKVGVERRVYRLVLLVSGLFLAAAFIAFWTVFLLAANAQTKISPTVGYFALQYLGLSKYTTVVTGTLLYLGLKKPCPAAYRRTRDLEDS